MKLLELKTGFYSVILLSFFIGGLVLDSFGEEKSNIPYLTDPHLEIKLFQTGLDFPTKMTFIDEETILVAQKYSGKVAVIKNFELQNYDALDLIVEASKERGLIGLASTNLNDEIIVYVYYTESISEFDTHNLGNKAKGDGNVILRIYQRDSSGGANSDSFDSGILLTDTDWHHIAWVQTSVTSYDVYVDGAKIGTKSGLSLGGTYTPDSNNVGSRPNNSQFYTGQIDDVQIYDFELTGTQVTDLFNSSSPSSLVAHYQFEDNLSDSTGNGNTGTAVGTETYVAGADGQAFDFDGSTTVQIDSGLVTTLPEYSITAWVKKPIGEFSLAVVYAEENSASLTQTKLLYWGEDFIKGTYGNKVVKYKWNGTSLVDPVLIMQPLPQANLGHNGGAMGIFNETLFLIIGDNHNTSPTTNNGNKIQLIDNGVILRVTLDGDSVPSNPFSDPTLSKYYAYGIRNGYGLDIDPLTNYVWDTENGPTNFDEINLVFPGFNSGWNKIMGPSQEGFFTSDLSKLTFFPGSNYSEPEFTWREAVGVTAIEFLESNKLGDDYQYDAFVGDVRGRLYHFELNEDRNGFDFKDDLLDDLIADTQNETASIIFGKNLGVITDIKTGPDGFLYILSLVKGIEKFDNWDRPLISSETIEESEFAGVLFRINKKFEGVGEIYSISPRGQIDMGYFPEEVVCKVNLELILKLKNNSPSCVTPITAEKLIARNWGYR